MPPPEVYNNIDKIYNLINNLTPITIEGQINLCDAGCNLESFFKPIDNIIVHNEVKTNSDGSTTKILYLDFNVTNTQNVSYINWSGTNNNGYSNTKFYLRNMIIFCPQKNRINNQILNNGLEINLIFTTLDKETVLNISILAQENNII